MRKRIIGYGVLLLVLAMTCGLGYQEYARREAVQQKVDDVIKRSNEVLGD